MNLANLPGGDEEEVDDQAEVVTENLRRNSHGNATVNSEENSSLVSMGQGEKRTRFSLSHDEGIHQHFQKLFSKLTTIMNFNFLQGA